jgi:hypothetical protein
LEVGAWSFRRLATASASIAQFVFAAFAGAMSAAKNLRAGLNAVPDDFAAAMIAFRRNYCDRTLEAIEDMPFTRRRDLKGFVVIVSAQFTFCHKSSLFYLSISL